ncbi:MAG: glutamate 5-kinase [Candidatus Omnitrophica bacterium]|nr:glutamate 5-kinase [Candidatus Omnitrophota bacterium]MDD5352726.1 glutamate 5-kinase [Candidatus Omnitrophota bacterium]MDD5550325.1 glutamate 5-kinase [Candidatus Omnitrophota bacterium]
MKSAKNYKRIVVKVGSSVLTEGKNSLVESNLERIVKHVADLSSQGKEVVLVTSGAIACGLSSMGLEKRSTKLSELQAAAAIGQNILMQNYTRVFSKYNLKCAQILLTRDDFHERKRYINAKNTILELFDLKVIPIINENDTVSVDEIKFGDNDMLSALVAMLIEADGLEILTDAEGLCQEYDKKKKQYTNLLKNVDIITPEIIRMACGTNSTTAIGGLRSKIDPIKIATNVGIDVVLTSGLSKEGLKIDFVDLDKCAGTHFSASSKLRASKKHWIAFGARVKGKIIIDDGAVKAILNKSASLLSPGVVGVMREFSEGDVVDISDANNNILARGITNYSSQQLDKIKGKKSEKEVVHRNNLVLLK